MWKDDVKWNFTDAFMMVLVLLTMITQIVFPAILSLKAEAFVNDLLLPPLLALGIMLILVALESIREKRKLGLQAENEGRGEEQA